ncbi:antibiotic biosynthesis monooxygenase [Thalassovita sp.]|uniref:antibiotic biosynthesis monooxygenase n=1 Tax=Thalassovita sp. TaxID=1979401 RepID=UPI002881581F|nr:antibiotic biosynthesis monooxygenase [Thalassovita sp.]MDF1802074.1 antibiotic biosynthesis monooxygenase [Thalassovita sp.]
MTKHAVEPGQEGPVTVSISRRAMPGRETDYEAWLHGIVDAASDFPGHMGVNILRPSGKTDGRYVLIYRFDSWAHCEAWERSDTRRSWVDQLDDIVEGDAETRRVTGLEAWFDLPEVPAAKHPPQWKMAITLIVVVFCIVFPLQLTILPLTTAWPHWSRTLLIAVIQVLLMTYLIMPRVTKAIKGWLYA